MNHDRAPGPAAASRVEVWSRKYDQRITRRWGAELLTWAPPLIVLRGVFEEEVRHDLLGLIERGTVSTEYYWTDRWYSIFEFVTPAGLPRNYYCNINLPASYDGRVLSYVDLDIDLLVAPDLTYRVLDEEEFRQNAARYAYPAEVIEGAHSALAELITLVETRSPPFAAPSGR